MDPRELSIDKNDAKKPIVTKASDTCYLFMNSDKSDYFSFI